MKRFWWLGVLGLIVAGFVIAWAMCDPPEGVLPMHDGPRPDPPPNGITHTDFM